MRLFHWPPIVDPATREPKFAPIHIIVLFFVAPALILIWLGLVMAVLP